MALTLWCFCPNVLGNGTLITPDVAAASLGVTAGYYFWRWLCAPNWLNAVAAGLSLGLAELTKSSWIVLFALWPVLWILWIVSRRKKGAGVGGRRSGNAGQDSDPARRDRIQDTRDARTPPLRRGGPEGGALGEHSGSGPDAPALDLRPVAHFESSVPQPPLLTTQAASLKSAATQLAFALLLALYLLNLGYGFEQSFEQLGTFQFISKSLGGPEAHEKPGNRFAATWLGALPVPFPANYLRGIDVQKYDFEKGKWSYLRGEQKMGGWWYYYLYAMGVKMPVGTLFLLALTCLVKLRGLRLEAPGLRKQEHGGRGQGTGNKRDESVGADVPPVDRDTTSGSASLTLRHSPTPLVPGSNLSLGRSKFLDELVLLAPALVLIVLVSSQTGFNRYLRYVVPAFPFLYVWISQLTALGPRSGNSSMAPPETE